jgi:hypothetical protein
VTAVPRTNVPALPHLRPWLIPAAVLLIGAGIFVYLAGQLHFALLDLARFALFALLITLPFGWLIVQPLQLPANGPPLARLGLALLAGYPTALTIYFAFGLMGLERFFPVAPALAAALALALALRRESDRATWLAQGSARLAEAVRQIDWGAVFVFWVVLLVCLPWMRFLEPDGADFVYRGYEDNLVHAAYVQELFRGVPPTQLPMAAGEPFPKYHLLHNVFVMAVARYTALDPLQSYFTLAPIVLHAALVLGLCLIGRTITGSPALGWLAAASVYVFGPPLEEGLARLFAVGAPSIAYFYVNGPSLSGLVVICVALACLALFQQAIKEGIPARRAGGLLYVAAFAAGALYLFKAEFFSLFFPAFLLGLGFIILRDRFAPAVASGAVALVTFGFFQFAWRAPSWAHLIMSWGVFAQVRLLEIQRLFDAQRYAYQVLANYLAAGHSVWPITILLTLVIGWRFIHLSPIIPAYLYNRLRAYRTLALWEVVVGLLFPIWLVFAFAVDAAELSGEARGLLSMAMAILLGFVSLPLNACLIGWFALCRWPGARVANFAPAAVLGLTVLVAPAALWVGRARTAGQSIRLTGAEMSVFSYLDHQTPEQAVVVQDKFGGSIVPAFSGRRVVVGRFSGKFPGRQEAVDELYDTHDTARAEAILRQYHVSYLIEYADAPVKFDKSFLHLAFDAGSVKVYQVALP